MRYSFVLSNPKHASIWISPFVPPISIGDVDWNTIVMGLPEWVRVFQDEEGRMYLPTFGPSLIRKTEEGMYVWDMELALENFASSTFNG